MCVLLSIFNKGPSDYGEITQLNYPSPIHVQMRWSSCLNISAVYLDFYYNYIETWPQLGVQVNQLTKICWHLMAAPIYRRLLGQSRFKSCFLPGMVVRVYVGDQHAVGWGVCVWGGLYKKNCNQSGSLALVIPCWYNDPSTKLMQFEQG